MVTFKHNEWVLESTDNAIVAKRKLTADELGHELLTTNQVLETDEYYLVPEQNENGHIIFYKIPKEG